MRLILILLALFCAPLARAESQAECIANARQRWEWCRKVHGEFTSAACVAKRGCLECFEGAAKKERECQKVRR